MSRIRTNAERAEEAFDMRKVALAAKRCLGGEGRDQKLFRAWLFNTCGLSETVARGTPEDTYRAIGRQDVGLTVLEVLEADMAYVHETYQAAQSAMED